MKLVFHYWNISWTLFPVSGICETFSSLAARCRLYSQPCLAASPPSIPLGVLSWTVSSLCPSLLGGFPSCKMCAVYFEICKQSSRNPSRSYQGDLRPRLLTNMRCEVQLYCQPDTPTDRHQDPEKQGLTRDGCVLLTGLDTDPSTVVQAKTWHSVSEGSERLSSCWKGEMNERSRKQLQTLCFTKRGTSLALAWKARL